MILSLLRKKDMRIQDFMRRSFSEHKMTTTAESPAVYEAANVYLNDKLGAFKQACVVSKLRYSPLKDNIMKPAITLKALFNGFNILLFFYSPSV